MTTGTLQNQSENLSAFGEIYPVPDAVSATLLRPENELEAFFLRLPEFVKGLNWGVPRYGHPEGLVLLHVREVLDNIEKLPLSETERRRLRLITFVHDTFKYKEEKSYPRDWTKHHGVLARRFLENFSADLQILEVVELHDEAYHIWCEEFYFKKPEKAALRLAILYERVKDFLQLYYLFFKCDTRTGDKNQAPLQWFEETFKEKLIPAVF